MSSPLSRYFDQLLRGASRREPEHWPACNSPSVENTQSMLQKIQDSGDSRPGSDPESASGASMSAQMPGKLARRT